MIQNFAIANGALRFDRRMVPLSQHTAECNQVMCRLEEQGAAINQLACFDELEFVRQDKVREEETKAGPTFVVVLA
ncbi:MAG: hypothetical protein GF344_19255 [Chitinivibrionales bacterium]|nr:hypothetical protein [Chitinivibrionales bacterium]